MTNQTPQSTFDEKAIEILETLSAEAFIFGNFALKKDTGLPLPDDNHELPPVEKALAAIKALVLEEVNKSELSDYATFKWLLKDALQPSSDTRKMSRIYLVQELVNKGYDTLTAQQRSIITKGAKDENR